MKLSTQLREDTGYGWVMARLEPVSPFGHALARSPRWYGPGEEGPLEEEFSRMEALRALLDAGEPALDSLTHILSQFRDIRNSLRRPTNAPMDEMELFEVKYFLLHLERLAQTYALIPALEGMEIQSMEESLNLLDPSGRRLPAFSVENAFAPALERVRAEKALVEGRLRQSEGTERDGLMACWRSLVERENQLELEARKGLTMSLLRQREFLLAAMEAVGRLDLLLAKARLARRLSCCRPEITKQPRVEAVDMVHPEAAAYLGERGGSFTAVSLTLERGTTVITGANMGGKSVSMKSLTLNLLLAQTGFFTFAGAFSAPLFHSVCLICTDRQSVEQGLSSFGAEMSALGAVLREEKDKFFYIALDEFARGTNPREGAALARALAEYLGRLN